MRRTPLLMTTGLALVLAGCAGTHLEDSRNLEVQGSAFDRSLYEGYIDRSEHEYGYGDYASSDLFALRAQEVAAGNTVLPLSLTSDRVENEEGSRKFASKKPAIEDARDRLMSALDDGARQTAPRATADAQVAFDCWVEETQPNHIRACRDQFMTAIEQVQAKMAPEDPKQMAEAPEPEPEPAPEPETFKLYFDFDAAALRSRASQKVDDVQALVDGQQQLELSVTGHADRAGPRDYNQELSLRRAKRVQQALVRHGVDREKISIAARGESEPAVATPDGVRKQANRRVVIRVQ